MNGASTNPDAHRADPAPPRRSKKAMESALELGGEGYVFWGSREEATCPCSTPT